MGKIADQLLRHMPDATVELWGHGELFALR